MEKSIPPFEIGFGTVEGNSSSSISLKKSKVSSTNLQDKLQFVTSVERSVFDLTKIPQTFNSTSRLIAEVLNDQSFFTESNLANWFRVMSSFVQVVISQNELKLLGRVEKCITLRIEKSN